MSHIKRIAFVDFEFNHTSEANLNLVCASVMSADEDAPQNFWLHKDSVAQDELADYLCEFDAIVAYNAVAEGRSFLALDLNPREWAWIDLFLEYRCLTNHNDKLNWGEQLVDGVVKRVHKPKKPWELEEGEENGVGFKHTHSLAEASFKLLGVKRDTAHKNAMRDLIISAPQEFSEFEKNSIMQYCAEDVKDLPALYRKMQAEFYELNPSFSPEELLTDMLNRGSYSAITAIMENRGYPLDVEKARAFSSYVESIVYDTQAEINALFPSVKPFRWDKKTNRFSWDQKKTKDWIASLPYAPRWERTATGGYSLSLEAFQKFFNYAHDYPTDNLGAQFVRFLKLKQSLNGFRVAADSKRKTLWDYVGSDDRVRPYFNIYGAQSSRSQPGATGFMMLKPAWMRALVQPKPGFALASIDYGSQEYLISALLSEDQAMIDAYMSGDVYLAFAKQTGMVPPEATKESHKKERDLAKSLVLGMSYKMTKVGLAIKLSQDSGRPWTEDEAQGLIDTFYEAYPDLKKFQDKVIQDYTNAGFIRLPCGWYMWGDNPNLRSVNNVPIQGQGASIMRKAVEMCFDRGVQIILTLHDALYCEYPVGSEGHIDIMAECMREAFAYYFDDKETARKIKLDPFAWSPNYEKDSSLVTPEGLEVECSNLYIDSRAITEYAKFSKYFVVGMESEL